MNKATAQKLDEWQAALAALAASRVQPRPPGSETSAELAAKWNISRECASQRVRKLVAAGLAERCGTITHATGGRALLYRLTRKGR